MTRSILVAIVSLAACHHHRDIDQPAQPQPQPQPEIQAQQEIQQPQQEAAPVDPLAGTGCTREDSGRIMCPQDDGWPLYITPSPGATQLDSFEFRAFAQPCHKFKNAMKDLVDGGDGFQVTCDDGAQQFRFSTTFAMVADTDATAWINSHLAHRKNAVAMLRGVGALRQ